MGDTAPGVDGVAAAALDRFFDTFYRQRPVTATFTGIHAHDDRLPDWSPDGLSQARDEMAALRGGLHAAGRSDDAAGAFPGDVDLALADATLEIAIAEHDSGHFVQSNPTLWIGEATFGVLSLVTRPFAPLTERLRAAQERLSVMPRFLAQAHHTLLSAPAPWLQRADTECAAAVDLLGVTLPAWVAQRVTAGEAHVDASEWASVAARAAVALTQFLRDSHLHDSAAHPPWAVPSSPPLRKSARQAVGIDMLELLLRRGHWVTTPVDELLHDATDALAEAKGRLDTMCQPYGGWPGAQDRIAAEHPSPGRYLARFHERWEECREASATHDLVAWPDAPLRYVPYPSHVAAAAPQLYYLHYRSPAPFDPFGTFEYVVPSLDGLTDEQAAARLRIWNESTITLNHVVHHGAIGHHVQNHHAYRGGSRIGRVAAVDAACRIAMFAGGSLAEGWACYVCDLMEEIGFLTPLEAIAQQHTRVRIAARAVADLSLHSGRFDVPAATLHYEDQALMSAAAARGEAVRNSMYPGTAVMYWLGTRGIHQLRAEVAKREGSAFSLRRFHDRLLSYGAIPVALISHLMLQPASEEVR